MGAAAYLFKPIKQSDLFDALMSALSIEADDEAAADVERPFSSRPLRILVAEDSLVNLIFRYLGLLATGARGRGTADISKINEVDEGDAG
jgi:hypothetical protein